MISYFCTEHRLFTQHTIYLLTNFNFKIYFPDIFHTLASGGRAIVFLHLVTLLSYFGGQLKAVCPFFLHLAQVRLDIQKGTDGCCFLDLSGQDVSECPVEYQYLHLRREVCFWD